MLTELILSISSTFTGFVSTITGMAGGIALLSIMTFFFTFKEIVPIHGVAQLVANSSRCFYLRNSIKRRMFFYYTLGAPIGAGIAVMYLRQAIPENYLKLLLALLIIYAVFKPKKLPELKIPEPWFLLVGICAGILGILIGSVGPFLAPFFVRSDLKKEEIIATKSMMQMFVHLLKIPSFLLLDFNFGNYIPAIVALSLGNLMGTFLGIKVLKQINEQTFRFLFKSTLFLAALRLLYQVIN
ncbi:MAG: sulfite exporter TauE/SafE family protein [Halobacteriovoraceae bacterium]|nr:sulfite exporter TauE/SafE family protein [Halobacteriovoraceae bacterium]